MNAEIQQYLEDECKELKLAGIGCAISFKNQTTSYSVGMSNIEANSFIDERSIFNIASVGKLLTTVSVLSLMEKGYFTVETEIGDLLTSIPDEWKIVKIKHLLSHSAGIKNYTDTEQYWAETKLDVPLGRILEYVRNEVLQFIPGSHWSYNNTGFYLLGLIIEGASQMKYFDFVLHLISRYKSDLQILPTDYSKIVVGRVSGYFHVDGVLLNAPYYSSSGTYSAGGFSANLSDFIEFENAIFNGKIIDSSYLKLLSKSFVNQEGATLKSIEGEFDFELTHGLFKFNKDGKTVLAHSGQIAGFSSNYLRIIEDNLSIIISTNTQDQSEVLRLTMYILSIVQAQPD